MLSDGDVGTYERITDEQEEEDEGLITGTHMNYEPENTEDKKGAKTTRRGKNSKKGVG